jgi:hypothetical protein
VCSSDLQALAVAGHPINSIGAVYFSKTPIEDSAMTAVTGTDNDGKVISGEYANKAWIRRYTGDQTAADFILRTQLQAWTTDHVGNGIPYVAIQYRYDEKTYQRGKPDITCIVEGAKVYDPRKDSTNGGSGAHRYDDVDTWEYSNNPALCLAWYLITEIGLGEDPERIDWPLVVAAANECDELVAIPGSQTQKRYTCNAVLTTAARFEDNITTLATAMMGTCYYSGGKWLMYAGAWRAPTFALTQDDVIGDFQIITAMPYQERYNAVRGRYLDAGRDYQEVEFNPRKIVQYATDDGEELWKEVVFPACTNEYEAQRNAIIALRMSRNKKAVTARFGMSAWGIRPMDLGTLTIPEIGWANQSVMCESWRFMPEGYIEASFREAYATDWSDPIVQDYGPPGEIAAPISGAYRPTSPDNLTATGIRNAIVFNWDAPAERSSGITYTLYEHTSVTPFSAASVAAQGIIGNNYTLVRPDEVTRYYWVTARDFYSGLESDPEPVGSGVSGRTAFAEGVPTVNVSPSSVYTLLDGVSTGNSASVTASASGGVSPYTYAWTRISGSTAITANSASAATTTFNVSSIADATTLEAVFRVTATDDDLLTDTADVVVTFERSDTGVELGLTLDKSSVYKFTTTTSSTTSSVTATRIGGQSPYSYAWTRISGSTSITATAPSSRTTAFSATGLTVAGAVAVFRCTVTDGASATATADCTVTFEYEIP